MLHDPLVEALEARREERQRRLLRELFDELLRELAALRGQRDHAMLRLGAIDGVEGGGDDVDAQEHARPAAVRLVVHLPGPERRVVAVAEEAELELVAEDTRERALLREPGECMRDEREDVEAHKRKRLPIGGVAGGDNDPPLR